MTKSELKNGAVLECRNGQRFLKIDNTLLSYRLDGSYEQLDRFNEDLTFCGEDRAFDIMRINNNTDNGVGFCNGAVHDVFSWWPESGRVFEVGTGCKWPWKRNDK